MAVAARIIQAVLLLAAVVVGAIVIVDATTVFADAKDYCFIPPGQDTLPQSCAQLPRFQVQAISTGALGIVALSLMVGAMALNPYTRRTDQAAPTQPAYGSPAPAQQGWQPGPPIGPYGQPPRA